MRMSHILMGVILLVVLGIGLLELSSGGGESAELYSPDADAPRRGPDAVWTDEALEAEYYGEPTTRADRAVAWSREWLESQRVPESERLFRPAPQHLPPERPYGERAGALLDAARAGDSDAARGIHAIFTFCRTAWRSRAELDAAIDDVRGQRLFRRPGPDGVIEQPLLEEQDAEEVIARFLVDPFETCEGVPDFDEQEVWSFVADLARQGDADMARRLGERALAQGDPHAARDWLQLGWEHGGIFSLYHLGEVAGQGVAVDLPQLEGASPEVARYVLQYAMAELHETYLREQNAIEPHDLAKQRLADQRARLYPRDREHAEALAREIIAANDACCLFQ